VPQLVARDIETGDDSWYVSLPPGHPRQWTCDARWVYLIGPRGLAVFDPRDGAAGWSTHLDTGDDPTVALTDDLVLLADGRAWSALDSGTGTRLWTTAAERGVCRVLDARGDRFLALLEADDKSRRVQLRQLLDGQLIWQADWPETSDIAWGRLSVEHALVAAASGAWRVFQLNDGSPVDLVRDASESGDDETSRHPRVATLLYRSRVIEAHREGLRMFGLEDGDSKPWISVAETGRPVTPLVGSRGRLYFANEQGRVICVGPRGTTP
jgi:outer membrane protein assembly factor BamB